MPDTNSSVTESMMRLSPAIMPYAWLARACRRRSFVTYIWCSHHDWLHPPKLISSIRFATSQCCSTPRTACLARSHITLPAL